MVYLVSIEGNIGSGKSTLVKQLRKKYENNSLVYFLDEPVNEWMTIKDKEGTNILTHFYSDTKKYAFSFQMMAYITRIKMLREAIRENPNRIFITERSVFTDRNVFAKMLYDDGIISKIDYEIYTRWFDEFVEENSIKVIYVNTKPEKCYERIKKRNRKGEEISLDYLRNCDMYHNEWLKNHYDIIEFDGNSEKEHFEDYNKWLDIINNNIFCKTESFMI